MLVTYEQAWSVFNELRRELARTDRQREVFDWAADATGCRILLDKHSV